MVSKIRPLPKMNRDPTPSNDTTLKTVNRTRFDEPHGAPPSVTIATGLATMEDVPPHETDFALADEIDPDALDELLTEEADDVAVTFTIDSYRVHAKSDGMVEIQVDER